MTNTNPEHPDPEQEGRIQKYQEMLKPVEDKATGLDRKLKDNEYQNRIRGR